MADWIVYRHKEGLRDRWDYRKEVRYYVPREWHDDQETRALIPIRTVRNAFYDKEDWPPEQAPTAGYFSARALLEHYEPEEK